VTAVYQSHPFAIERLNWIIQTDGPALRDRLRLFYFLTQTGELFPASCGGLCSPVLKFGEYHD